MSKVGGFIRGKSHIAGNSPKNDTVDIKVSPGEIIIDKETLAKGPNAIMDFVMNELEKHNPGYKKNFDTGGTTIPYDGGAASNPNYQGLSSYFNGPTKPSTMAPAPAAPVSIDQRLKELDSVRKNLPSSYWTPADQQEYNTLKAKRGYSDGGTVSPADASKMKKVYGDTTNSESPYSPGNLAESAVNYFTKGMYDGGTVPKYNEGGTPMPDWAKEPPTKEELHAKAPSWTESPPSPEELSGEPKKSPETSIGDKIKTAAENYGNAVTMGYLPQIQAATEPAMAKVYNAVTGDDVKVPDYVTRRDENIKRIEQESERNPKSALAGQATGIVAGAAMTPGMGGAGLLGKAARGAAVGAAYGAAQNPGDVKGVVDPIQGKERLENAEAGAKFGAVAGAAGHLIEKGIGAMKNSADAAQEFANAQAVRASGAMLKDFRQLAGNGKLDEMGQFALDNGIVKAGDTVKSVAKKAEAFREKAGEDLDKIYSRAQGALESKGQQVLGGFNPAQSKDQILAAVGEKMGDNPNKAKAVSTIRKYVGQLERDYGDQTLDPKKANDIKTAIDKEINYARNPLTKNPAAEEGYSVLRNYINDAVKSHVEQLGAASGDPKLAEKLAEANKNYGNARQFQTMAEDRINRLNANNMMGIGDKISGAGGAVLGYAAGKESGHGVEGAIAGLSAGLAHKAIGKFGAGLMASGANKIAVPVLENTVVPISEFLKRSPKDFVTKAALQEHMLNRKKGK